MSISDIQADATWGLQRVTQRSKLVKTDPFALTYSYPFAAPAGAGASESSRSQIGRAHV
mgnify:CR=1 FL=1